jgi:predicted branched-subunit amino acid permease
MTPALPEAPRWSWGGLREGALLTVPLVPGIVVFAAAFGTLAAQKGLSLAEATLMSALVYAGASQLVALEAWERPLTISVILALALVTATVNLRFVLMGASLRPWLGPLPSWQSYGSLAFLVDAAWLLAIRHRQNGGNEAGVFLGAGLALWAVWVGATVPGYMLGALVSNPARFGLDFVVPAFFSAMLVPLWRGPRMAFAWTLAGVTALLASMLIGGWWFVIIGAVAGTAAAAFIPVSAGAARAGPTR